MNSCVDKSAKDMELKKVRQTVYEKILAKAENGDIEAWNDVGYILYSIAEDMEKAFDLFHHTASQGSKRGILGVAVALYDGDGVKKDYQKAYKVFAELADEDEQIKDFCIVWASFGFPSKFAKSIRSKKNCEKGAEFVREKAWRIRESWQISCWTKNFIDYSEADIKCCRNKLPDETEQKDEDIDFTLGVVNEPLKSSDLHFYVRSDRDILDQREKELNQQRSAK